MKKIVLFSTLTALAGVAFAQQETARVVSVTPVMHQVSVPRQVCGTEMVTTTPQKSGAGAVMGAIAGGAMGNAVGGGNGRAATTMLGLVGGAILGDRIEGSDAPQVQNVQRCSTQYFQENRIANYHVVYEFGGKQYTVQMPYDPGPTIKLQLTPISAAPTSAVMANAPSDTYPVVVQRPYDSGIVVRPSISIGYSYGNYGYRH